MPNDPKFGIELLWEMARRKSRQSFSDYLLFMNPDYQLMWFHRLIAETCQKVFEGEIKRLMIFIPPQHGKSQITSRSFPTWALGKNPKEKIVCASYSGDLSNSFCLDAQRMIALPEYADVFGNTVVGTRGYLKNSAVFETTVGGYYKTVGVGGALTGRQADIAIIDDPVKDALEANSSTYRKRTWDWYTNVLETRLHNNSKVILIMTRWHEDDLAGKLLKAEPEKWIVLKLPAIRNIEELNYDSRKTGEPLWGERHSLERLMRMSELSPRTFASLYQQSPVIDGGNIIKSEWFDKITLNDFNMLRGSNPIHFFVDTAYTSDSDNDPTGIIGVCQIQNRMVIVCAKKVLMKFPDLIRFLPTYVKSNGYTPDSTIRIEPKANGLSVIDQLREMTSLNITQTPSPSESKETRLNVASPTVEGKRVLLLEGHWNDEFVTEVCGFPAAPHDEYVDLLVYAIDYVLKGGINVVNLTNLFQ